MNKNGVWQLGIILSALVTALVGGLPAFATESTVPLGESVTRKMQKALQQPEFQAHLGKLDCSHLVHALYNRLGLSYPYATSRSLYSGIEAFRQVSQPESGDLVVWRGHVGIVVDPSGYRFLSALRSGVRTASYISKYWKRLGRPRFFRYALSKKIYENGDGLPVVATEIVPGSPPVARN